MELRFKKLKPEALVPDYSHPGDAGFDLCSTEKIILAPGDKAAVPTGFVFEIPDGFVGLVWDKSGLSIKNGLKTLGGVVDAGYRGEVLVGMINLSKEVFIIEPGQKVAQMLIQKVEQVNFVEVKTLTETSRGENGFGSSGK